MPNLKILIKTQNGKTLVQSTTSHRGSNEFNWLLSQGYEEAGTIKVDGIPSTLITAFWEAKFFDPQAKYQRPEN